MVFDMLMSSIKEMDEITLSQNSIAVKGFVLAIHLVVVESFSSLTEVVVEHCSSSEPDSDDDDDADECRQKLGKKHILSPIHARLVDSKSEKMMASKIFDLRDSSETGDDLAIPDMMFVQGEEPLGLGF
ncbi:hypothetical protein HID58_061666 [Brassica napus]|uniref:Condensin complex subunit 2 n=1 Tax=Brassica napus TaxID=3708 RepID=A0ABQ7ZZ91_BRANA|nr:hypothetical protein HID58_061666 [Brassica napus]